MKRTPFLEQAFSRLRPYRLQLVMLFMGVLIPLCLFGVLAAEVTEQEGFFFDIPILMFMHSHATPLFDRTMLFFTHAGSRWSLVPIDILVFVFLMTQRHRASALFWGFAVGGAALLNLAAKNFFARIRPDLWPSLAPETTFSFPSGHSVGSMAFAVALVMLTWPTRWRWPVLLGATLFAFLVGLSRVYLGVHYPSDVIAGWAASLGWVVGLSVIFHERPTHPTPVLSAG